MNVVIYSPTKVKHHLNFFNNIFSNNELISNRFAVFVTCTHILTYMWNRLLIDFYLCVYDRGLRCDITLRIPILQSKHIFKSLEFRTSRIWSGKTMFHSASRFSLDQSNIYIPMQIYIKWNNMIYQINLAVTAYDSKVTSY
jgi:hypothetical protein